MAEQQQPAVDIEVKPSEGGDGDHVRQDQPQPQPQPQSQQQQQQQQPEVQDEPTEGKLLLHNQVEAIKELTGLIKDPKDSEQSSQKEKLAIYKALAIKLKKELLRTREELAKLKLDYSTQVKQLRDQVEALEKSIESERVTNTNTNATLEATIRNLRNQLQEAERDLESLQIDFDHYKARAAKILQQGQSVQSDSNKKFEEERCKQLKSLTEDQKRQIKELKAQVDLLTTQRSNLEIESKSLADTLTTTNECLEQAQNNCQRLTSENENLKSIIEQCKPKSKGKHKAESRTLQKTDAPSPQPSYSALTDLGQDVSSAPAAAATASEQQTNVDEKPNTPDQEDEHTNSSSSFDSSTYGYVHIKPTPFEIISRTSVLEDAQNQIDNLTKAYLDSESTNSLLTEQVKALKEEIRRIQRGNDRMELANNLEYLKNVMFKFLSLDNSQVEQKQRLIPVLSTILKLSPDETSKLNSLASIERSSVTSSFFKL